MSARVFIIGDGGREHALAWKLAQSRRVGKVYIALGNGGTSEVGENVPIDILSPEETARFATEKKIDLTVVVPEVSLAIGLVDLFQSRGLPIWGPTSAAARIETSKVFAKRLMEKIGIPTAPFASFDNYEDALKHVRQKRGPFVVKANGLAHGKGVHLCDTQDDAVRALWKIMIEHAHGDAGKIVIIEKLLSGPEVSVHALTDGIHTEMFPLSQDHKKVFDFDKGENTGGMGAIAPLPHADAEKLTKRLETEVVIPLVMALQKRGSPLNGCLYPGIKMTDEGFSVLEVNARLGDPETQVYMPLLKDDLFEVLSACAKGELARVTPLSWRKGYCVCVVLASGGYPGAYRKGIPIKGLREAEKLQDVQVFHARTMRDASGALVTNGGRVLGVTAFGESVPDAIGLAYEAAHYISFEGRHYRRDIGEHAYTAVR